MRKHYIDNLRWRILLVLILGLPLPIFSDLLSIGGKSIVEYLYLFLWADGAYVVLNDVAKYVSEWVMVLALIGLAKRYLSFNGPVSEYMKKRSFLFFTYHFILSDIFTPVDSGKEHPMRGVHQPLFMLTGSITD